MPQPETSRRATLRRWLGRAVGALARRSVVANVLQLTGAAMLSWGVGLVFVPAGVIAAGICLLAFGLAAELGATDAR